MKTTKQICFRNSKGERILKTVSVPYLTKSLLAVMLILLLNHATSANNISVSNVSLTGLNTTSDYVNVKCNISWDNSWRTSSAPNNWDAAWVFVKYRVYGNYTSAAGATSSGTTITVVSTSNLRVGMPVRVSSGTGAFANGTVVTAITSETTFTVSATPSITLSGGASVVTGYAIWEHATLSSTSLEHTAPSGSTITSVSDGMGIFIYRNADGTGTNTFNNAELRWNYGLNGVADGAPVDIKVFAMEMVYVPQGSFYLGSGGIEYGSFTDGSWISDATIPLQITSENPLNVEPTAGNLWGTVPTGDPNCTIGGAGTLSADFPKGFKGFYCMKYEISQQEIVDFLNTLTYRQQAYHVVNPPQQSPGTSGLAPANTFRNGIDIQTSGVNPTTPAIYACNLDGDGDYAEPNDGKWVACNYVSWRNMAGYLDWSGLRPMTELEFEKACRGSITPVPNEYAWGTTNITLNTGITNAGENSEISLNSGNCSNQEFNGSNGPMRVGAFATSLTNREQSGATYYGIMEMTGNIWERIVTIGNSTGRSFTGLHGNGLIDFTGIANVDFWPNYSTALGCGLRGGSIDTDDLNISNRTGAVYSANERYQRYGGRGVRTAP